MSKATEWQSQDLNSAPLAVETPPPVISQVRRPDLGHNVVENCLRRARA